MWHSTTFKDSFLLIIHLNRSKPDGAWRIFPIPQKFQSTVKRQLWENLFHDFRDKTLQINQWKMSALSALYVLQSMTDLWLFFCLLNHSMHTYAMLYICFETKRGNKHMCHKHMAPIIHKLIAFIMFHSPSLCSITHTCNHLLRKRHLTSQREKLNLLSFLWSLE